MDQTQDQLDPEVAQEVITLLNKKIANLRNENAQLQSQLSRAAVKSEDQAHGVPNDRTQRLVEEIEHLKSEIERRQDPEEVVILQDRLKKSKRRRQQSEQKLQSLSEKLEESESDRRTAVAAKEALEEEIEGLRNMLSEGARKGEESVGHLGSPADEFDFRGFLDDKLGELPPRPTPTFMTVEEKRRLLDVVLQRGGEFFYANSVDWIMWADEGGGCVVPLPSVVYNGKNQTTEAFRRKPVANHSYEFCGVDKSNRRSRVYYGTYHCVRVITIDWEQLMALDQESAERFLGRVVVERGFVPPVFLSFIQQLYKTGTLKVDCVVLRFEHFDTATVKEVRSVEKPPTIINVPSSHNSGKRLSDQQHQERAEGSSKKPRLKD